MDEQSKGRFVRFGMILYAFKFPVGMGSLYLESGEEIGVSAIVALLQMCGVRLGYDFEFQPLYGPCCSNVDSDYEELCQHSYILAERTIPHDVKNDIFEARKLFEYDHNLAISTYKWVHALTAFHKLWLQHQCSKLKAQTELGRYHMDFAEPEVSQAVIDALQSAGIVPT